MEILEKTDRPAKRLGYDKLETAEIVTKLNVSLSTYQVFFHKLQNFHWNTVGSDFFDVHELTEEMYKMALVDIDEIAERVRVFGKMPEDKLSAYLKSSIIEETSSEKSAEYMFYELIADLEKLTETFLDVHEHAAKNGDVGTTYMISKMIKELETYHWQLSSWASKRFQS